MFEDLENMLLMKWEIKTILDTYKTLSKNIDNFNKNYIEDSKYKIDREWEHSSLSLNIRKYTFMFDKIEEHIKDIKTSYGKENIKETIKETIKENIKETIKENIKVQSNSWWNDKQAQSNSCWSDYPVDEPVNKPTNIDTKYKKNNESSHIFRHFVDITDRINFDKITDVDITKKIEIRNKGVKTILIDFPLNILEKQNQGVTFAWNYNPFEVEYENTFKSPFILKRGKLYWIGSDRFMYEIDDKNNLVIGEFKNAKQCWEIRYKKGGKE